MAAQLALASEHNAVQRLLILPREIRYQIFENVCGPCVIQHDWYGRTCFEVSLYGGRKSTPESWYFTFQAFDYEYPLSHLPYEEPCSKPSSLAWLETCRQIYVEFKTLPIRNYCVLDTIFKHHSIPQLKGAFSLFPSHLKYLLIKEHAFTLPCLESLAGNVQQIPEIFKNLEFFGIEIDVLPLLDMNFVQSWLEGVPYETPEEIRADKVRNGMGGNWQKKMLKTLMLKTLMLIAEETKVEQMGVDWGGMGLWRDDIATVWRRYVSRTLKEKAARSNEVGKK